MGCLRSLSALALLIVTALAQADEVRVAVAANFTAAMREIASAFEQSSGHQTVISYGSTGKLYAQIIHGAPFDLFLAADQVRPEKLEGNQQASGRFTYAIGKLVLWSSDAKRQIDAEALKKADFSHLALANPKTAPYGVAAMEVMQNLGIYPQLQRKLVTGDSIAQTHQFVSTGNAQLGFIALAQIVLDSSGSRWLVPDGLYTPIRQDAVLLTRGNDNRAARALIDYLQSDTARTIIRKYGYATENTP
ncbi:molybdate ABC transporter substrate-binding protein [Ectothiorhodospiraceae bacterium BW-2]|nr:molybdate ABC transporter substrate-binding protein [Ectothiorhodospiraceae bacterium BW-2]